MQGFENISKFARKEIQLDQTLGFLPPHKETQYLERVKQLRDDHIVELVTSYCHNKKFNIVFPCSMANLDQCLRQPEYRLRQTCFRPLSNMPLWKQMYGLANALDRLAQVSAVARRDQKDEDKDRRDGPDELCIEGGPQLDNQIGFHFDLKPANILVDRNKAYHNNDGASRNQVHFRITDFGLAHFKESAPGNSGTGYHRGDEEYGPPESGTRIQNRKYDVWSLGCIFLEVLAFVVLSYGGVEELDQRRGKASRNGERTSGTGCYWEQPREGEPTLKAEIETFLGKLLTETKKLTVREAYFIADMVLLVRGMLCIKVDDRFRTQDVKKSLDLILRGKRLPTSAQAAKVQEPTFINNVLRPNDIFADTADRSSKMIEDLRLRNTPLIGPGSQVVVPVANVEFDDDQTISTSTETRDEVQLAEAHGGDEQEDELRPQILRGLQNLFARSNVRRTDEYVRVVLQIFENHRGNLRFVTTQLNPVFLLSDRAALRRQADIVPEYAFSKDHDIGTNAGIRFVYSQQPQQTKESLQSILDYDFSGSLDDLRRVHGVLMGQEIYHSIEVRAIDCERPVSTPMALKGTAQRLFSKIPMHGKGKVVPSSDRHTEEGPVTVQLWREKIDEFSSEVRYRKIRTCRIVVYLTREILVIPFHDFLRAPKAMDILDEHLVDMKMSAVDDLNKDFPMSVFRARQTPDNVTSVPTFPLDRELFHRISVDNETDFKSLNIRFRDHIGLTHVKAPTGYTDRY